CASYSMSAVIFFFSSRRRHTRFSRDWSSDVCSSDLFPLIQGDFISSGVGRYSGSIDQHVQPPQLTDSEVERFVHRRGIGDITDPAFCPTASLTRQRLLRGVDIKTDNMGALSDVCRDYRSANAARAACHDDSFASQLHGAGLMQCSDVYRRWIGNSGYSIRASAPSNSRSAEAWCFLPCSIDALPAQARA